jgi:catechol 2,3-dioxygenase-like lactoylglutathione lyase family enzyme
MSEATAPTARARLDVVVLDCPDTRALSSFYADLLGWEVRDGSDEGWVTIVPAGTPADAPAGSVPALAFQKAENFEPPTWPAGGHPQQFHLDLLVDDLEAGERDVLAAGATRHEHQPSTDGGFVVYLDPAGHPFCLVR